MSSSYLASHNFSEMFVWSILTVAVTVYYTCSLSLDHSHPPDGRPFKVHAPFSPHQVNAQNVSFAGPPYSFSLTGPASLHIPYYAATIYGLSHPIRTEMPQEKGCFVCLMRAFISST